VIGWKISLLSGQEIAEKKVLGGLTAQAFCTGAEKYFAGQAVRLVPTEGTADFRNAEDHED
jgi:hypothetical protein